MFSTINRISFRFKVYRVDNEMLARLNCRNFTARPCHAWNDFSITFVFYYIILRNSLIKYCFIIDRVKNIIAFSINVQLIIILSFIDVYFTKEPLHYFIVRRLLRIFLLICNDYAEWGCTYSLHLHYVYSNTITSASHGVTEVDGWNPQWQEFPQAR